MNEYELIYIVTPRRGPAEVEQLGTWLAGQVTSGGGEVLSSRTWGRRRMAYPIAHNLDGTYVIARLRMPAAAAVALDRALHIQEDVIRHMVIRGIMGSDEAPPEFTSERPRFAPRPVPTERAEFRAPVAPVEAPVAAAASESVAEAAPEATAEAAPEPATESSAEAAAEPAPADAD
ncbi:MAG: 30S ribosomal protein S6 [Dehalococcoidia bacterium]|nr:30S ribosomal protein S6 [Dehalococcoidia bacterium]